jgi:hypothetical protein
MLLGSLSESAAVASWEKRPDFTRYPDASVLPTVPKDHISEVGPARPAQVPAAMKLLAARDFVPLNCVHAQSLAVRKLDCPATEHISLVRAVRGHAGTGAYFAYFSGTTLFIHHGSLGRTDRRDNVPLLISTPFVPTEVFRWASVDE